jgi:hypothetical protein
MKNMILLMVFFSVLLIGIKLNAESEPCQLMVEECMRQKINTLGQNNSFAYIDIGLTKEEIALIDKLKFDHVQGQLCYNRFGQVYLLEEELPTFLRHIGNDDEEVIKAVTKIISRTTQHIMRAANKNSAWISVRAFCHTHMWDIPRWHIDGPFYGPYPNPDIVFKLAVTLKGPSTLLYKLPDDMRNLFNANMENRIFLSELLDIQKAESPKRGDGVLFIVGDEQISAVHSEPKMDENRLFFSVLIGDQSQIEELYTRWFPEKVK